MINCIVNYQVDLLCTQSTNSLGISNPKNIHKTCKQKSE